METKNYVLPPVVENRDLSLPHFPTHMQAFVFRCWEMVPVERIAAVLHTTVENVTKLAEDMGLLPQENTDDWMNKGYITIIRSLWHILPYNQLCELLGWSEERLACTLKEDDLLFLKLGEFKPECPEISYSPLSAEQQKRTKEIYETIYPVTHSSGINDKKPFDFIEPVYPEKEETIKNSDGFDIVLENGWSIICEEKNERISGYIDIFCEELFKRWGIQINRKKTEKTIALKHLKGKEEYHKILIAENKITIEAGEEGILRALSFLLDKAAENGGAFYKKATYERDAVFHTRFLYPYFGLYGQVFDSDSEISFPDEMLKRYSLMGINGIWTQAVLYQLIEFPFDKSISKGWQKRLHNLQILIKRAARYGIKVYLYLNEPRAMPLSFFDKYPEMRGRIVGDYACICTSSEMGRKYLHDAVYRLCKETDGLGGFFVISRSENLTNCYSHAEKGKMNCPRCAKREPYEVVADINRIVTEAAEKANPDIKVIAWPWSWMGPDYIWENIEKGIALYPKSNPVMDVSENEKELNIGGVPNVVRDYSMAHIGPSAHTKRIWDIARKTGHDVYAKLQINTTWECSTVPSLPVYSLLIEHLEKVRAEGVSGLMLGWTLGGYPSANLKVASCFYFKDLNGNDNGNPCEMALRTVYGDKYEIVKEATDIFGEAFKNFPFNHYTLYHAPHNPGVSNLLYEKPSGYKATMTCYSYDDIDGWRANYPKEVFMEQYRKIHSRWSDGLKMIEQLKDCELWDTAFVGYSLFKSTYEQIRFIIARDEYLENHNADSKSIMLDVAQEEIALAKQVYQIMRRNPTIGYEAANHYYFNKTMILEKMINCQTILNDLVTEAR